MPPERTSISKRCKAEDTEAGPHSFLESVQKRSQVMAGVEGFCFADIKGEQIGKLVRGSAYISGESGQKAVYTKEAMCSICQKKTTIDLSIDPVKLYKLLTKDRLDVKAPDDLGKCGAGKNHR